MGLSLEKDFVHLSVPYELSEGVWPSEEDEEAIEERRAGQDRLYRYGLVAMRWSGGGGLSEEHSHPR